MGGRRRRRRRGGWERKQLLRVSETAGSWTAWKEPRLNLKSVLLESGCPFEGYEPILPSGDTWTGDELVVVHEPTAVAPSGVG